ncbi:MAG: polyprenyl synthetase family protein [Marinilabiliaceae bacterium]|nr:polyprenyl synthetase family protein [Marinilabiliaceae bacterium]
MISIETIRTDVDNWLKELEFKREPRSLYTPITYSLSLGGKRLRPVMCIASCALFKDDYSQAKKAALAIEMFHNFTLLHDDVMDNSQLRRGQPTVMARWNTNTAILSGDQMLIEAYKLISDVDSPSVSLILETFNQTATEVCEGQQYDMDFEKQTDVTIAQYMEMIRLKTAVLLAASIKIGALVGGANIHDTKALYDFGINIGLAFQLQDDLLDVYGDEKVFGKPIGGDIMEGKKTYLLITALEDANSTQKKELLKWIENSDAKREEKIKEVTNLYNQIGVKEKTELKIDELMNKAMRMLIAMEISAEGKRFMADFVASLIKRNH